MEPIVLLNIGDSISKGMGVSKDQLDSRYILLFRDFLKSKYNDVTLVDLSENGCTSEMALRSVEEYLHSDTFKQHAHKHHVVVCHLGNVDGKIVPKEDGCFLGINFFRLLPKKYQGANLDPRPYFSSRFFKGRVQRFESFLRTRIKRLLIYLQGGENIVPLGDYQRNIIATMELLKFHLKTTEIIYLSTVPILHSGFPGSETSFRNYDSFTREHASTNRFTYLDVHTLLLAEHSKDSGLICSDKFHINELGHLFVSRVLRDHVKL